MKIAIIGAGAAGLAAAKYSAEEGFNCEVFEQTGLVGGTWNYTDQIGTDEYGLPVHSSMYKGLLTNVSKEVMYYPDFPYPDYPQSYIEQDKVIKYINDYGKHFNLFKYIQFYKHVIKVNPVPQTKWEVTVMNLKTKTEETKTFDAVMICKGNYSSPFIPDDIPNKDKFKGKTLHSHDYRCPDKFTNKTVLVIGAGPSGVDIAKLVSSVARKVFISHDLENVDVPQNVTEKPIVKEFYENGVIFIDGTKEEIDDVIYCTGYLYTYPFLTSDCGITVSEKSVKPLFKHMININHPTMCIIGIPFLVCPFPLFDIQVRFFMSALNGKYKLPSKAEMLEDLNKCFEELEAHGIPKKHFHKLGEKQGIYFEELANLAKIKRIPPVITKIFSTHLKQKRDTSNIYKIIDDETFRRIA